MKRRYDPTVTEAAEYLHAIFDEFTARNDTSQLHIRRARILLDVCVDQALKAVEANAKDGEVPDYVVRRGYQG